MESNESSSYCEFSLMRRFFGGNHMTRFEPTSVVHRQDKLKNLIMATGKIWRANLPTAKFE